MLLLEKVVQVVLHLEGWGLCPSRLSKQVTRTNLHLHVIPLHMYYATNLFYMVMVDSCCYVEVKAIILLMD